MENEIKSLVLGIDVNKEILDLWYQSFYMSNLISIILHKNPQLAKAIQEDHEVFDRARKAAQQQMKDKFPKIDLEYK